MTRIDSQDKGKRGEKAAVRRWLELCPKAFRECSTQAARGRKAGPDVRGVDGWWIEVKFYKKLKPADLANHFLEALAAMSAGNLGYCDVVVDYKENRKPVYILVLAEALRRLGFNEENHKFIHKNLGELDVRRITWEQFASAWKDHNGQSK